MPFARPAGYNLGNSGWVEMHFTDNDPPPVDLLLDCIEESYRAVAPKTLVRELDARYAQPLSPTPAPAVGRHPRPGQFRRRC